MKLNSPDSENSRNIRKSILMIAYYYPPDGGSGTQRTLKFSKYLSEFGWSPEILTVKESSYQNKDESLLKEAPPEDQIHRTQIIEPLKYYRSLKSRVSDEGAAQDGGQSKISIRPEPKSKSIVTTIKDSIIGSLTTPDKFVGWLPFGIWKGLQVFEERHIDIIFSTSPPVTTHLIANEIKRLTGKPWIADFRDPWNMQKQEHTSTFRKNLELKLELSVINNADRIIANTDALASSIIKSFPGINPYKVSVINNGYDEEDFSSISREALPATDKFSITHTGEFYVRIREPETFLRGLSMAIKDNRINKNDVEVNFIGGGEYTESTEYYQLLEALDLEDVVVTRERVPHCESIQYLYKSAVQFLLQPSGSTSLQIPAKAFEYLRIGRPILTLAPDGATANLIKGLGAGYVVDPDDVYEIADAVSGMYKQWKADGSGSNGRKFPIAQFNRQVLTGILATVLDNMHNRINL
jgi:glycosyltransferase involved in cell wall biosynthesis